MRLAFVTPRFGAGVLGGSEARVREEARGLAARGHDVEVLTTCALDGDTWRNELPEGAERDGDVTVRRFPTVPGTDASRRDQLDRRVLSGVPPSPAEEADWIDSRYQVPGLARHVARSADRYDSLVYSPYLAWTTLRCLPIAPERAVLMPCLHDEPAARLASVRAALAGAGEVWFQSDPEHLLGHRVVRLGRHVTVGSAVNVPERYDVEAVRARFGLHEPYVLYAGRREDGKGWPEALRGFATALAVEGLDLRLVTIGEGDSWVPGQLEGRVLHLGFVEEADVPGVFAGALAYLQPSRNESFSRTVMESWLAGTVVVARATSEVVAWHCERSGGGLLYGDELELAASLRAVVENPAAAAAMAAAGRRYVLDHYTWPTALDRIEDALERFCAGRHGAPAGGVPEGAPGPTGSSDPDELRTAARRRAAAERAALRGVAHGGTGAPEAAVRIGLADWLPQPGIGVPGWTNGAGGAGVCGPTDTGERTSGPAPASRRVVALAAEVARRHPLGRRAVRAALAARRAFGDGDGDER